MGMSPYLVEHARCVPPPGPPYVRRCDHTSENPIGMEMQVDVGLRCGCVQWRPVAATWRRPMESLATENNQRVWMELHEPKLALDEYLTWVNHDPVPRINTREPRIQSGR